MCHYAPYHVEIGVGCELAQRELPIDPGYYHIAKRGSDRLVDYHQVAIGYAHALHGAAIGACEECGGSVGYEYTVQVDAVGHVVVGRRWGIYQKQSLQILLW